MFALPPQQIDHSFQSSSVFDMSFNKNSAYGLGNMFLLSPPFLPVVPDV